MHLDRASVEQTLAAAGCVTPRDEADALLHAAGDDAGVLAAMVARRIEGEPLAWITGSIRFCGLDVRVTPGVYVPRWQTEPLARMATSLLPADGVAIDLCTGAGAIAMLLAVAAPTARVVATDVDPVAVACACANGVDARAGWLDDPLPDSLEGTVDVLTAVPPYVPTSELRFLPRDVQRYEPRAALDGGTEGTEMLMEIVRRAPRWLRPGGNMLLELGGDQAEAIAPVALAAGFDRPDVLRDAEGDPRGIVARRSAVEERTSVR
jgi:release factor glutamine methyltransferase